MISVTDISDSSYIDSSAISHINDISDIGDMDSSDIGDIIAIASEFHWESYWGSRRQILMSFRGSGQKNMKKGNQNLPAHCTM